MRSIFSRAHVRALNSLQILRSKRNSPLYHKTRNYASAADSLPRVVQPSFWHSIAPKFLRERNTNVGNVRSPKSKEWNPATFYIVIFLLIGSNAIQMIALRNDFATFSRKADAKISLLKEVLERVHRGEDVDVKGLLGTGNEEQEKEWEEVLKEIVEDQRYPEKKPKRAAKQSGHSVSDSTEADTDKIHTNGLADSTNTSHEISSAASKKGETLVKIGRRPSAFY